MSTEEQNRPEAADEARAQEDVQADAAQEQVETGTDLEARLEQARGEAQENWDKLLRTQAELENQRRRHERDVENAHKYALERFSQALLPVKDSLEMGLSAMAEGVEQVEKLREGTELTLKMLADVMEKFGISEVDPAGEPFNPELHQAMAMQQSDAQAPNTVLHVMQKGYLLNDRLIRPAMVVVAKAGESGDSGEKVDEQA